MARLILFNKPYGVLSQFTDRGAEAARVTLKDFVDVPGVYPAGRLDRDSEGLLVLTDDGGIQTAVANPRQAIEKRYWVQVEGIATEPALEQLRRGLALADGPTRPAQARSIAEPALWPRDPPVR